MVLVPEGEKIWKMCNVFIRFDTMHERDGHTDTVCPVTQIVRSQYTNKSNVNV